MDSNDQQINKIEWVIEEGTKLQEGKVEPIQKKDLKKKRKVSAKSKTEVIKGKNLKEMILQALESSDEDEGKIPSKIEEIKAREEIKNQYKKIGHRNKEKAKTLYFDTEKKDLVLRVLNSEDEEEQKIVELMR
jgi:hypothetical protein